MGRVGADVGWDELWLSRVGWDGVEKLCGSYS